MQIKKIENYNSPIHKSFQGRVNIPGEKFFTKLIRGMNYFEIRNAETRLFLIERENKPIVKQSFLNRIKEVFSPKKEEPKKPVVQKTLKEYWDESLNIMKTLVITKLPDAYILACRKSDLSPGAISFNLKKGKEYIYGVSANINDPKFPEECIKKAVKLISNPESKKRFAELQEIFPDLTENLYIMNNEKFLRAEVSRALELNKKLKKEAAAKELEVSMQDIKNKYGVHQVEGTIKNKEGEIIYETNLFEARFYEVASKLEEKLKSL